MKKAFSPCCPLVANLSSHSKEASYSSTLRFAPCLMLLLTKESATISQWRSYRKWIRRGNESTPLGFQLIRVEIRAGRCLSFQVPSLFAHIRESAPLVKSVHWHLQLFHRALFSIQYNLWMHSRGWNRGKVSYSKMKGIREALTKTSTSYTVLTAGSVDIGHVPLLTFP